MHRTRKKPNVAKLSGFNGSDIPRSLAADGQRIAYEKESKQLNTNNLTEEQKLTLRAAGYKIPD